MSTATALDTPRETSPALPSQPSAGPIDINHLSFLLDPRVFEHVWRVAKAYSISSLVPQHFRGKTEDCFIACQLSLRLGVDPFMLMQGLYVIQGRPGMEAKLQIALCNARGPFTGRIQFRFEGSGKTRKCTAFATDRTTGEIHECTVDWALVEAEGWNKKNGSKWLTMPDQMFAYRAAAWLIRRVCPEVVMGMMSAEEQAEMPDVYSPAPSSPSPSPRLEPPRETKSETLADRLATAPAAKANGHAADKPRDLSESEGARAANRAVEREAEQTAAGDEAAQPAPADDGNQDAQTARRAAMLRAANVNEVNTLLAAVTDETNAGLCSQDEQMEIVNLGLKRKSELAKKGGGRRE